ncbi:tyrosine-type recombinase/integrase [Nonomuraea sp. NPDC048901]|uniref:tyrosine-type recombinase/integrase n=1 Tax=Nonomuraea sp. NPDC048901 TaxID=3155627 RepID=UPI0033DD33E1
MSENNVVPITAGIGRRTANARQRKRAVPTGTPLAGLIDSWELALEAAGKAPATLEVYLRTARRFVTYLQEEGQPDDAEGVQAEQVRMFLIHERTGRGLPTAVAAHAYLGVWWNWIISEGERTSFSPVLKADKPQLKTKAHDYLTMEEISALLDVCKGSDFASRRDTAIIRVFIDNGMRVGGLCGLRLEDVDLRGRRLKIVLKGGDEHWAPIGDKTATAIDRYLRVRARHARADSEWLWLGIKSIQEPRLLKGGVQGMLKRRGKQADVKNVHPHRFRSTSAHQQLAVGANSDDVRRVLGWRSEAMLRHYTEELGDERAREAHARVSPSDRI